MEIDQKFWNKKKILITGHTGFKGSWLGLVLSKFSVRLYGISLKEERKSLFYDANLKKIFKNYYFNLSNYKKTQETIKKIKPDIIFHFAAQSLVIEGFKKPHNTYVDNILATLNILESSRKIKNVKCLFFSTTDKVYKNKNKNLSFSENDELKGNEPYSSSKVCCEEILNIYKKFYFKNKIGFLIARAGNVIGGGDWNQNRLIPDIFRSIKNKKQVIIRNPKHTRPWQYVLECLFYYILLTQKASKNHLYSGVYNIFSKSKKNLSVNDVIKIVEKKIKFKKKIKKSSKEFYESKKLSLDSKKLNKIIKLKNLSAVEMVAQTTDWYISYLKSKNALSVSNKIISNYIKFLRL